MMKPRPRPRIEGKPNPILAFKGQKKLGAESAMGAPGFVVPPKLAARAQAAKKMSIGG